MIFACALKRGFFHRNNILILFSPTCLAARFVWPADGFYSVRKWRRANERPAILIRTNAVFLRSDAALERIQRLERRGNELRASRTLNLLADINPFYSLAGGTFTLQTNNVAFLIQPTSPVYQTAGGGSYHYQAIDLNTGNPLWEEEAADPNNPNTGILTVFIDNPTNGSTLTQ
jgi:hypothetical protein